MAAATHAVPAPARSAPPARPGTHYLAVDVLRGLTIAFMIMVNNNGDEGAAFAFMKHAAWNGFTPTDLVFPTFLFLVGAAIVFSTEARLSRGETRATLYAHTVRRTVILFVLGLLVNGFPFFDLATLRYYGVLQRIALCYLLTATWYLYVRRPDGVGGGRPAVFRTAGLLIACLLVYYAVMRFVPVPGYGLPGRDIPLLDRDANLVAWLDRALFSSNHLYEQTRDPEGLLSTIPALATTLAGVLTGMFLRRGRFAATGTAVRLAAAGAAGVLLGAMWNPWFPINKKLWTSSYVLFAAGWSLLLLAACWYVVQARGWRRGTSFLLVFGTNAITAYVIAELIGPGLSHVTVAPETSVPEWVYLRLSAIVTWPPLASLTYSALYMLLCWALVYPLYRKRIFIKI